MPPLTRQNSSDQAPEKKCLCLRPSSLLAACFLVVAAVVLAYLGGVMSGRAYWRAHPQPVVAKAAAPAAQAVAQSTVATSSGAPVTFSNATRSLDSAARAQGDFDAGKVKAMREAIQNGTFKVNPEAIADKMLANAQEVFARVHN